MAIDFNTLSSRIASAANRAHQIPENQDSDNVIIKNPTGLISSGTFFGPYGNGFASNIFNNAAGFLDYISSSALSLPKNISRFLNDPKVKSAAHQAANLTKATIPSAGAPAAAVSGLLYLIGD